MRGVLTVVVFGIRALPIAGWLYVVGLMFEYVLFSLSGKDVATWADILAGCVLSPLTFTAWLVCLILRAAGLVAPFFG